MRIMVVFGKTGSFSPTDQISTKLITSAAFENDDLFAVARGDDIFKNDKKHFYSVESSANVPIKKILSSKQCFRKKVSYCFQRFISKLTILFLGYDALLVSCYKKTMKNVIKSNSVDAIIAISGCYECNVAGYSIAHKYKINLFSYLCDPYPFVKKRQFMRTFRKTIKEAKKVFVPLEYYNDYVDEFFEKKEKFQEVAFPCLLQKDIIKSTPKKTKEDKIVISYFGSLGYDGRDLNELSKVFGNHQDVLLNLYTSSEDSIHQKNIRFNKMVSEKDMVQKMLDSDFLLVVDNNSKMLPSKCVRYVSTTLPIIVLTSQKESSIKMFLNKYKNYFIHFSGNSSEELYKYIFDVSRHPFKFDEDVYNAYLEYLPENVFNKIRKNIN